MLGTVAPHERRDLWASPTLYVESNCRSTQSSAKRTCHECGGKDLIALRLEAIASNHCKKVGGQVGWRPSLVGWRPLLLGECGGEDPRPCRGLDGSGAGECVREVHESVLYSEHTESGGSINHSLGSARGHMCHLQFVLMQNHSWYPSCTWNHLQKQTHGRKGLSQQISRGTASRSCRVSLGLEDVTPGR